MKWFKRTLWLAALGVWVWLGVGLYRELPRSLGPQLCKIDGSKQPYGFVGETDVIACYVPLAREAHNLALIDARTGESVGDRACPLLIETRMFRLFSRLVRPSGEFLDSLRFGCLLGRGRVNAETDSSDGLYCLDVMADKRRQLSTRFIDEIAFHPTKSWIAMAEGERHKSADRIVVADCKTGRKLFERPRPAGYWIEGRSEFIAEGDRLLISIREQKERPQVFGKVLTEVWRIGEPSELEAVVDDDLVTFNVKTSVSLNGRMLAGPKSREDRKRYVFDLIDNRRLPAMPESEQVSDDEMSSLAATQVISPNGRCVLTYGLHAFGGSALGAGGRVVRSDDGGLFAVDASRKVWKPSSAERVESSDTETFDVRETWHELWKDRFATFKYVTHARRSLDTGKVLYRMKDAIPFAASNVNASRTLVLLSDGAVHSWPLPVAWKLLAVCQAVLAAPLVVLWTLLRWRRRRSERSAARRG